MTKDATGSAWTRRHGDDGSAVELTVVMMGVFALLTLLLMLSVRWLAAEAASAAAQRALEIAQSPGGDRNNAQTAAVRLASSTRVVDSVDVTVSQQTDLVTVSVTVRPALGGTVTRTATGPELRFVPQQRP
ncbi:MULTISPECIES: hypothetical protein [unclassified Frankia]|uniref:hypothetical protein n=1 Tax=unclassified Frankia TaxID=2632575 RepID=UPI001EF6E53F|nr:MULTISPECIES: hypothetical protein [unclassified Frankia]